MGMVAGPELAAAVSNAGGFGVFGTHGIAPPGTTINSADNTFDNPALEPDVRRPEGAS
jgi:NAD(P)H-dependent flavin oxidoreductase YrpB (nitropropane dioxygenase family)